MPTEPELQLDLADPSSIEGRIPQIEEIVAEKGRMATDARQDFETWQALLAKLRSLAGLVLHLEEPSNGAPYRPLPAAVDAVVEVIDSHGGPMRPVDVGQALAAKGHEVDNAEAVFAVLVAASLEGRLQRVAPRQFAPAPPGAALRIGPSSAGGDNAAASDGPPQSKAEAILRVLASEPGQRWTTSEVAKVMIERHWMTDSRSDLASLGSTLSRLHAEGRVVRPQRGRYQLASDRIAKSDET